jgi:hypothetical protein
MLAKAARMDERQVRRCLRRLEAWGLIAVERKATNRLPTMYCFPGIRGDISDTPREDISAPPTNVLGGHFEQLGGTFSTSRGDIFDTHIYKELEPSEDPSEEPSGTPLPPKPTKKKTRMSDDWEPGPKLRAYAVEWGIPEQYVDEMAREFREYWLDRPRDCRNWDMTFQNRVRDVAPQYQRRARMNGHATTTKPEDRRPAIPTLEQVLQPPKHLSDAKRAELAAIFAERRQGR